MTLQKKQIYIADPSGDFSWLICKILKIRGYNTFTSNDFKRAAGAADFLIIDYLWFRNQDLETKIMVSQFFDQNRALLISTFPTWAIEKDIERYGLFHVVEKPFDINNLAEIIENVAKRTSLCGSMR